MSIDTLTEATKERVRRNAKAVWNWPPEYCATSFITRLAHLKEAYGKEYKGRESHLVIKAYQGVEKMVKECTQTEFYDRFPYFKFPELYKDHPRF